MTMWLLLLLLGYACTGMGQLTPLTSDIVSITYSSCTTYTDGTSFALPPVTKMARTFLSSEELATITPVTIYTTTTLDLLRSTPTTFPVRVINPTDVDPIIFADLSARYQPYNCLTATSSVDYRQACQTGEKYQMEDDWGISCGKLNPCCFNCSPYNRICIGNCPRDQLLRCDNGVDYYIGGGTSIDSMYNEPFPTIAFSDRADLQTATSFPNGGMATATPTPTGSEGGDSGGTGTGSVGTDGGEKLSGLISWSAPLAAAIAGILVL